MVMATMKPKLEAVPQQVMQSDTSPTQETGAENISQLMDGELDSIEVESVCQMLRDTHSAETWTCYHVIGDALRGSPPLGHDFAERFSKRLSAEPTVLAPGPTRPRPLAVVWAAAAT